MSIGNIMVGQSGGPTAVINSSVAGVFKAGLDLGAQKVYGMLNGVEGLIAGRYADLTQHIKSDTDIELLKRTPSSFLGTCRYKLASVDEKEEDYKKVFDHLKKLDIKAFFYTGGNDSMDSINKMADYAKNTGSDIRFIGVPKTIDNDLAITDHCPGFGSAAKYIATTMKEIILDATSYNSKSVLVVEIMGRNAGWLTAASVLASGSDNDGPDIILPPEIMFNEEVFLGMLSDRLQTKETIVVAVSEGIKNESGKYIGESGSGTDAFGHVKLSGAGGYLKELIEDKLKLKRVRAIEFSAIQRCAAHITSRTDAEEAFLAGVHAARSAAKGETAKMVIFKRLSNEPYAIELGLAPVSQIANAENRLPKEWIDEQNYGIRKEFTEYARPLIMGELQPLMVNGTPKHFVLDARR